ncbi:MAG: phosphopantothenoylcysteine decarboxylase [Kiritimatiellia bacterium]
MKGRLRLVVTAGPTREHLDPVRFLSNPSTGKMGFAIAAEAARRGHEVTLVAGPVALRTPPGVRRIDVVSAREMLAACQAAVAAVTPCAETVFVATAAVADWRPAQCAAKKLKKGKMSPTLRLVRNPDILKTLSSSRCHAPTALRLVGFAAETNDVLSEASRKCREKRLAFVVANDVTESGCGFGTDTNRVSFVFPDGRLKKLPLMTKRAVARRILDEISELTGRHEDDV